jgi:hypothetical protein
VAFNVSEFSSKISQHGLSKDNLFILRITPPNFGEVINPADLIFFCKSVDLPAMNVDTVDIQRSGWGKIERMPAGLPYDQLQAIFMIDTGFKVKAFFHRWLQSVVNFDSANSSGSYNGLRPHQIAYKDDYVGTIEVIVYSYGNEEVTYVYKFFNAFPTNMGNITTSWESNDNIMTVPLTFTYDTFISDGVGPNTPYKGQTTSYSSLGGTIAPIINEIPIISSLSNAVDKFTTIANLI